MNVTLTPRFAEMAGLRPKFDLILGEGDPRAKIMRLEAAMRARGMTDLSECTLTHHFAPGSYARELAIPKDRIIIGKIHKHAHVNVISKGRCTVYTEDGGRQELQAPLTFVSTPGTKRVVLTHEETVWTTIHVTDEMDLDKIEERVIAKSYEDLESFLAAEQLRIGDAS